MKLAIIGTGNLGKSIANGLLKIEQLKSLYLTKRHLEDIKSFEVNKKVTLTTDNLEAVNNSDILLFAVQPSHFESILVQLKNALKANHVIISTIAGFDIQKIETLIGSDKCIVRAMPNTAIAVGKSMTCLCSNAKGKAHIEKAKSIFGNLGHTILIPEIQMQAATVVCASRIAFWMRLVRATTQAAIQLGFDAEEAQALAMHTCEGAASLLITNGNHPEQEIDNVTTPQGCTIEGLNEMEHKGLSSSLIQGMVASYKKINAIQNEQL